jgi:hypothetical protein
MKCDFYQKVKDEEGAKFELSATILGRLNGDKKESAQS